MVSYRLAIEKMSLEKYHPCPICFQSVFHWERYPRAVCGDCHNKACDAQGRKLSFFNISMSGGFEAFLTETQEKYLSHTCYIDSVECRADEARLGGIVIEALSTTINFYHLKKPYGFFSNFAPYPIDLKGKIWPTSEHYFQAQKFIDTVHEEEVRQTQTPREAAQIGRDWNKPLRPDWEVVKDNIMREALYAKFTQHLDLKDRLLGTRDATLVEHTKNDTYWGDGGDGSGKNMLGKLLMETRELIRYEDL
jgi:ribA/ribD-fused uncharacterized protein